MAARRSDGWLARHVSGWEAALREDGAQSGPSSFGVALGIAGGAGVAGVVWMARRSCCCSGGGLCEGEDVVCR